MGATVQVDETFLILWLFTAIQDRQSLSSLFQTS